MGGSSNLYGGGSGVTGSATARPLAWCVEVVTDAWQNSDRWAVERAQWETQPQGVPRVLKSSPQASRMLTMDRISL
jgi:hypothetical protein